MKSNNMETIPNNFSARHALLFSAISLMPLIASCGGSPASTAAGTCTAGSTQASISTSNAPNGTSLTAISGANVIPITVGSSLNGGINQPSVSVTICNAGATCVTVPNILVDTGSYGLRVFKSFVSTLNLPSVTGHAGGLPLGECVGYADNSADWGPVVTAKVTLGTEAAVTVPIQIIDSTFANPAVCSGNLDTSPTASGTGFNGILGVGLFAQDCGNGCVLTAKNTTAASNGYYYGCSGSTCTGDWANLSSQVTNPVYAETTDNNGVIVELPSISGGAASSSSGYLVLGIGTRVNNTPVPSALSTLAADPNHGTFDINCNGQDYSSSYIDSGSNAVFFGGGAADMTENPQGWYNPANSTALNVLVTAASGGKQTYVPFTIADFDTTVGGSNFVYSNIAGDIGVGSTFDLGLPFFFGRNVYVGLENSSSTLGSGTYWAF